MNLEIISRKKQNGRLMELLQGSVIPEINIYNQVHLEIDCPILETNIFHKKTQNEIGIQFKLSGELSGNIICLLDLYEREVDSNKFNEFQSLFVESMNILLGRMLTNLEEDKDILALINHPKVLKRNDSESTRIGEKQSILTTTYNLITGTESYSCRIYFIIEENETKEV